MLGLEHIHLQNIAHNDLQMKNILIGNDGNLKIADFGLAKIPASRADKFYDCIKF